MEITSRDNRLVKDFVKITTSKRYRDENNVFALEGIKLIKEAFENNVEIEMVFVTLNCYDKNFEALEKLFQKTKYNIISSEVEKKMSTAKTPQGIFAICSRLDKVLLFDKIENEGKYIMLVDLQDAGNVGTIIRTAEAIGIDGIIATKSICDIYSPKVIRGSMGSSLRMPILFVENEIEFLTKLSAKGVKTYASVVDENSKKLSETQFPENCVLLIGNEGNGLPKEIISQCFDMVTISMRGKAESLNASMAACILMWEMLK